MNLRGRGNITIVDNSIRAGGNIVNSTTAPSVFGWLFGRGESVIRRSADGSSITYIDNSITADGDIVSNQQSIFSQDEEKRITVFFGSDLVDSIKKLKEVFDKKTDADRKAERAHIEEPGEQELIRLIETLKARTPRRGMNKEEASADEGVQAIAASAQTLKERLKLNSNLENKPILKKYKLILYRNFCE